LLRRNQLFFFALRFLIIRVAHFLVAAYQVQKPSPLEQNELNDIFAAR
jgi:hypothetical protein